MRLSRDVPLAPLTTLRLGGRAAAMATVTTESELVEALLSPEASGGPVFVLGGGSNLVVADEGYAGLVVKMASRGVTVTREGDRARVDAAAGEDWDALVARTVDEGYSGLESLSGIPGLVGATPIQNVGAYGHEVKDTLVRVRVFDREEARFVEVDGAACGFGYRTSVFRGKSRWVIVGVTFVLPVRRDSAPVRYAELARALGVEDGGRAPAAEVRRVVVELRRSKGMVLDPGDPDSVSAGSFFVNPTLTGPELAALEARATGLAVPRFAGEDGRFKVPAAWLVERAGFTRGFGKGGVGVSTKHCLALVNRGGGTTKELLDLARAVQRGVRDRFGVTLSPEPVVLGTRL